jgi:hypothetical protein
MIAWPTALIREIVQERCILFLGAGVSATARDTGGSSPPSWSDFLTEALKLVHSSQDKEQIQELIKQRRLLTALQGIQDSADRTDYINLLNRHYNRPYQPSRLHEIIAQIDCRIVITTNFDKIYEGYCLSFSETTPPVGYKILTYKDADLGDEIRSDTRLIVKAHGSINTVQDMIFTRDEYHAAKSSHRGFYEIIKALFLTNTVVFVGCGLDDPDILLTLEEVRIFGRSQKPHYAIVLHNQHSKFVRQELLKTHNIKVLEYGPSHAELVSEMEQLLAMVNEERAANAG